MPNCNFPSNKKNEKELEDFSDGWHEETDTSMVTVVAFLFCVLAITGAIFALI